MLNPNKINRKDADPSAAGKGRAGVLPVIPDIESALCSLDDEVRGKMLHEYEHGVEKGQTTHNKYLDPYFKWMPGYTNVVTGWPGHGKSQLFFELLLVRAVFDQKKSIVWPSENLPAERFYKGLVHTLTGRSSDKTQFNHLSAAEYGRAMDFVREYIFLVNPPSGMPYTPAHILAYFDHAVNKHGATHCMFDPWNKADHSAMTRLGGIEPYLVHALGLCTKWSMDTGQCLVITAHPKRADENMGYGKTRPVPTGGMISGGQTWENMAHWVGATHRPFDFLEDSTEAAFFCHKCKDERNVAKRGMVGYIAGADGGGPMVPLRWDEPTNRYRWGVEKFNPLDNPSLAKLWAPAEATLVDSKPIITASNPVIKPNYGARVQFGAMPASNFDSQYPS